MATSPGNLTPLRFSSGDHGGLLLQRRLRAGETGNTLLNLLAQAFPYHSRDRWLDLINCGSISVNGKRADAEQILIAGDLLAYQGMDIREPETPRYFEPILYTEDLLLIGKPAGIPVTRTGLIVKNTFINLLRDHYGADFHPLHRLDRETSGLLLCARGSAACSKYQRPQASPMSGKYYLAVVFGSLPIGATICSEQPLAIRADSPVRCRMWPESTGKACRTVFHILAVTGDFSLVLAELQTGRRHQIRAHLAHLGHPVVGDKIYSHEGHYYLKRIAGELVETDYQRLGSHNQLLHAWALRMLRPGHPEQFYFSQLFSEDFREYLSLFPDWEEIARRRLAELAPVRPLDIPHHNTSRPEDAVV